VGPGVDKAVLTLIALEPTDRDDHGSIPERPRPWFGQGAAIPDQSESSRRQLQPALIQVQLVARHGKEPRRSSQQGTQRDPLDPSDSISEPGGVATGVERDDVRDLQQRGRGHRERRDERVMTFDVDEVGLEARDRRRQPGCQVIVTISWVCRNALERHTRKRIATGQRSAPVGRNDGDVEPCSGQPRCDLRDVRLDPADIGRDARGYQDDAGFSWHSRQAPNRMRRRALAP
jgi:hypothetical protein